MIDTYQVRPSGDLRIRCFLLDCSGSMSTLPIRYFSSSVLCKIYAQLCTCVLMLKERQRCSYMQYLRWIHFQLNPLWFPTMVYMTPPSVNRPMALKWGSGEDRGCLSTVSGALLWNIPLHCLKICCFSWFTKEADWPIVGKNRVGGKTEKAGKKYRVRGAVSRCRKKQGGHSVLRPGTKPQGKA